MQKIPNRGIWGWNYKNGNKSQKEEYEVEITKLATNPKQENMRGSNYKIGKRGLVVEERGISEAGVGSHHLDGGLVGA